MRIWIAVLLAPLVSCCGSQEPARSYPMAYPTEATDRLIAEFAADYGHAVTVPVLLVHHADITPYDSTGEAVGMCVTVGHSEPDAVVLVDIDYWYQEATPDAQWALIFHELGHCVLGRGHEATHTGPCPDSLMNDTIGPTARCMERGLRSKQQYVQELFSN